MKVEFKFKKRSPQKDRHSLVELKAQSFCRPYCLSHFFKIQLINLTENVPHRKKDGFVKHLHLGIYVIYSNQSIDLKKYFFVGLKT